MIYCYWDFENPGDSNQSPDDTGSSQATSRFEAASESLLIQIEITSPRGGSCHERSGRYSDRGEPQFCE